jgi:hypothetical protein
MSRSVYGRIRGTLTPEKTQPTPPPVQPSSVQAATASPQQPPVDDSAVISSRPTPPPEEPVTPVQPVPQVKQPPQVSDDEQLKQISFELKSTLIEQVGQLKSPHREVLVPIFNAADAAVKKWDLPVAQKKVADLKKGLDAISTHAAALKSIVAELQSTLVDEIGRLPKPYPKDLAPLQHEALALANKQDLKGAQAKVAELKKQIAAAKAKIKEFDDLGDDPEALKQWGVDQAKKAYAAQMKKDESEELNPGGKFNMKNLQQDADINKVFNGAAAQDYIRDHKLSEAEAKAVITYTAVNYKYINPATANQKDKPADFDQATKKYDPEQIDLFKVMAARKKKGEDVTEMEKDLAEYKKNGWLDADNRLNFNNVDPADREEFAKAVKKYKRADWMDTQNRPDPSKAKNPAEKQKLEEALQKYEDEQKKSMYEEGALHAGMIMEAFKKLPKYAGPLYRGRRMNPGAFASQYAVGKKISFESLSSFSKNLGKAKDFADHGDPNNPPPADCTVSVLLQAKIPTAADIQALSLYASEEECLIPPGTELVVKSHQDTPKGAAPVDRCVTVILEIPGAS